MSYQLKGKEIASIAVLYNISAYGDKPLLFGATSQAEVEKYIKRVVKKAELFLFDETDPENRKKLNRLQEFDYVLALSPTTLWHSDYSRDDLFHDVKLRSNSLKKVVWVARAGLDEERRGSDSFPFVILMKRLIEQLKAGGCTFVEPILVPFLPPQDSEQEQNPLVVP